MNITIIQTNWSFLVLKWAIAEQFQEYLLWKPVDTKPDNNLLTYIMATLNLDATQHCWVESLAGFTFSIEYSKGQDYAVADSLSWVTSKVDMEMVSPSWMESPWEQKEVWMLTIQQWPRLMKRYINKFGKLQSRLELRMHVWTCMWLTGWPLNRKIQYLRL